MYLFKFIYFFIEKQGTLFYISLLFHILISLVEPFGMPIITTNFIDCIYTGQSPIFWVIMYILSFVTFIVFFLIDGIWFSRFMPTLEMDVRHSVIQHLYNLPIEFFHYNAEAEVARKISLLIDNVRIIMDQLIRRIFPWLVTITVIIINFFMVNFYMGLTMILWFILHGSITMMFNKKIIANNNNETKSHLKINEYISDTFKNRMVIATLDLNNDVNTKLNNMQIQERDYSIKTLASIAFSRANQSAMLFFTQGLLANGLLLYLYYNEKITMKELTLLFQLIGSIIHVGWRFMERLPEIVQSFGKCKPGLDILKEKIHNNGTEIIENPQGNINIENLTIAYKNKVIVENLSVNISSGDRVLILGESGIGKSTIMNCLYGFIIPLSGFIEFDGVKRNLINQSFFSKYCNFITSKKMIFFDTIYNNLFSKDEQKIQKAIENSLFTSTISKLAYGINTMIGNNASNLSEGQCQRLNICRSIINHEKSNILFMDEPLTSLDDHNASQIMENLINLYNKKTIIAIDHSLKFLQYANKIIFLDGENIITGDKNLLLQHPKVSSYIKNHIISLE